MANERVSKTETNAKCDCDLARVKGYFGPTHPPGVQNRKLRTPNVFMAD